MYMNKDVYENLDNTNELTESRWKSWTVDSRSILHLNYLLINQIFLGMISNVACDIK